MGAKQSSLETPLMIYNEPNVRFSHGLVEQLQQDREKAIAVKKEKVASQPTDYSQSGGQVSNEELENVIRVRVDNELRRIREREDEIAQRTQEELFKQRVILRDSNANAVVTEHEINELIERIQRKYENKFSSEIIEQQRAVISCYKNNGSRTLDCWEEVQKFKRITREAAQEYVTSHR